MHLVDGRCLQVQSIISCFARARDSRGHWLAKEKGHVTRGAAAEAKKGSADRDQFRIALEAACGGG